MQDNCLMYATLHTCTRNVVDNKTKLFSLLCWRLFSFSQTQSHRHSVLLVSSIMSNLVLNYSLPVEGGWTLYPTLHNLQAISIQVPSVGNSSIQKQRVWETIDQLANLYISSNGSTTSQDIARFMGTNTERVELLIEIMGGNQSLLQTVLWSSNEIPQAPVYHSNTGVLALSIIFIMVSCITTAVRLYSRYRLPGGVKFMDYSLIIGLLVTIGNACVLGNCKSHSRQTQSFLD